jgi:hypothetical protein
MHFPHFAVTTAESIVSQTLLHTVQKHWCDPLKQATTVSFQILIPLIIFSPIQKTTKNQFWEEPIAYFPLIGHGPHRKLRQQFFVAVGTCLQSRCLANDMGDTQTHSISFDTSGRAQNMTRPTMLLLLRVHLLP